MHFTSLTALSLASLATAAPHLAAREVTGKLGNAQVVTDNPSGAMVQAYLVPKPDDEYQVSGYVRASSSGPGSSVKFDVGIFNLPDEGSPFIYHIHDQPVDSTGNCSSTLAHLDPYIRGEMPPCDASAPWTCQVGDLAGKHGHIPGQSYTNSYTDQYTSLKQGTGGYFGNRSITVHKSDTTRIACANFEVLFPGFDGDFPSNWQPGWQSAGAGDAAADATAEATSNALTAAWGQLKAAWKW
ncbi:hypothetical protein NA57DRAFT_53615 [Rhizodiscina lignyota]|uniref:superoxide dismutase n=1 Tax=Rhizodiscina lignyota TaxID=1504668 RepID=A0A9P4ILV6_9PEZI|nr:hypothetical protein NA57DRAFT_53615 [Rhizodiscina lignyota]